uniref:Uncharacterized protein n=1 Tax=Physcomitrium patens TaxID=3218 RepID=A0A7I4CPI8_PHYPA
MGAQTILVELYLCSSEMSRFLEMQTSWISSTETLWRNSYLCDMKRQGKITEKLDSFQMFGCVRPRVGLEREAIC